MKQHCTSYCTHGGSCVLEKDHDGLHDSRYCQWTDEEAISKEEANEIFLLEAKFNGYEPLADFVIAATDMLENKLKELNEE